MTSSRLHIILFISIILQVCTIIYGDCVIKSSLTFVIDDTGSMSNEILQVKDEINKIFDTVVGSNASQIENFILVTFNDPDAKLRIVTKDRNEFKRALAAIKVDGGGFCPEYAMKGIEIALEESLPSSYLYVFTDASAEDYHRFEYVKNLALKKQIQVDFMLTGICGSESDNDYQVYHKLAEATSGMVFNMGKKDIKDILKYVEETIKSKADVVVSKKLAPGYGHKVPYYVDSCDGATIIAATGDKPKIGKVTGPGGSEPKTDNIITLDRVAVSKVTCASHGVHEVEVGSKSETHAVISAKTSIDFQLRFSAYKPRSISDAVSRPPPTGIAFLSVKLIGDGVKLNATKILDMKGEVITELPLELMDEKEQFYISPSFDPPTTMFRVSISGYHVKSGVLLTRNSPTAIERQPIPKAEEVKRIKPQVTIGGGPKIITEYNVPLQLKCKVHGYPQPDITWVDKGTGIKLPATVLVFELPYDFMSILDIEKANKNTTYECKANNAHGENAQRIEVETKRKIYFDLIETPKDIIHIEYDKKGSIICKVDAYPPVTITWFKDGRVITGDANIEISSDKTSLTIKHMQPDSAGKFMCEARNDIERKVFHSNVFIFGLKTPEIYKNDQEVYATIGTNVELFCRVTQGIPKPKLSWSFQHKGAKKFTNMKEINEIIHLKNVRADQAGLYKCIADNIVGSDNFTIELQVEYKPKIQADVKSLKVKDGDKVTIKCDVDGVPEPVVKWYYNGKVLENTAKTRISSDHSLSLQATLADAGYYTCEAINELGSAEIAVNVIIFVPVSIDIPKMAKIETMVGNTVMLPCAADGYPVPKIKWIFHSYDPKTPSKDITSHMASTSLKLHMVQLKHQGNYTCVASNDISGSANITYELYVYASPIIENEYVDKTYEAVEGDLILRIKCKATGSPKPTIIWRKDGLNLAYGSEWYDLEEDGTLVIKNIDSVSQGTYICLAQNTIGNDTAAYEVVVKDYPEAKRPTYTVFVKEGQSLDFKCNISHKNTDLVRWYKDGKLLSTGNLSLYEVTRGNDGLYTCRVSDLSRSRSVTTKVVIGSKPKFYYDVENTIEFIRNDIVELDCNAEGTPEPTVTWKHNGIEIDINNMIYALEMTLGETGIYTCEVSNKFGSIQRSFNITSRDCIIDITQSFPEKQPIMISRALTWPTFEIVDGYMVIPNHDYYFLNCPSGFLNFPLRKTVIAKCEGDTMIKINNKVYNFAEIQCNEEARPNTLRTGIKCLPGNTEYFNVGYNAVNSFIKVYEVCFDKENNVTLFTKQHMTPYRTGSPRNSKWFSSDLLPLEFDTMYDCNNQVDDISYSIERKLSYDSCCFTKRQLVNSQDLRPGIPAAASFYSLNVIPHWSTCNTKNWEDLEERIRSLVETAGHDLLISTGAALGGVLPPVINLRNGLGGSQTVPQYLWKVVQDPVSSTSLAIIQVNIPELSPTDANDHVLCHDICHLIDWMKNTNWNNTADGFTYCCSITEFEKAFGFNGVFSPGMNHLLYDVYVMPETYLKK